MNSPKYKISIVGLGFVGLSLAVTNASKGFETIGIETDKSKIKFLKNGKPSFFEPKLEKLLRKSIDSKKLSITENYEEIKNTDITFLTVGTPSYKGKINLEYLHDSIKKLKKILKNKKLKHVIVVKSTVIPTTTINEIIPVFKKLKNVTIIVNPEFLREGKAINDLLKPHLIVIGENDGGGDKIINYYKQFYKKIPEIIRTDLTTAEMIKYSNNAFLATKISFINSIANLCQNIPNVDVSQVAYAIGKDSRIGSQFLQAGPGFGGSCLPKDLSALISFSKQFKSNNNFFKSVKEVNDTQPKKVLDLMNNMGIFKKKSTVSILGLSFKKDTDDIREAVSIKILNQLLKKKIKIKVHDPMALKNIQKLFGSKLVYNSKIIECVKDTDCCIILTEWDEYKKLNQKYFKNNMKNANIIDARRIFNPKKFMDINFKAIGLGLP